MKRAILLTLLQLGAQGMDAYYTHRNMERPQFHEYNPIARQFTHSTGAWVTANAMEATISVGAQVYLRRKDHKTMADVLAISNTSIHTACGIYTATHGGTGLPQLPVNTVEISKKPPIR